MGYIRSIIACNLPKINNDLQRHEPWITDEIVRIGYDAAADTLYAHFEAYADAADREIIPENDNIILGLDDGGNVVRITIMNASTFQQEEEAFVQITRTAIDAD